MLALPSTSQYPSYLEQQPDLYAEQKESSSLNLLSLATTACSLPMAPTTRSLYSFDGTSNERRRSASPSASASGSTSSYARISPADALQGQQLAMRRPSLHALPEQHRSYMAEALLLAPPPSAPTPSSAGADVVSLEAAAAAASAARRPWTASERAGSLEPSSSGRPAKVRHGHSRSHPQALDLAQQSSQPGALLAIPSPTTPRAQPSMAQVADWFAQMVCYIWYQTAPGAAVQSRVHSELKLSPRSRFVDFVRETFNTTQLSNSVILLALLLVHRLRAQHQHLHGKDGSEYRLAICSMMLANKILDDACYTSKTWSDITRVPLKELNRMEVEMWMGIPSLWVSQAQYQDWLVTVQSMSEQRTAEISMRSQEAAALRRSLAYPYQQPHLLGRPRHSVSHVITSSPRLNALRSPMYQPSPSAAPVDWAPMFQPPGVMALTPPNGLQPLPLSPFSHDYRTFGPSPPESCGSAPSALTNFVGDFTFQAPAPQQQMYSPMSMASSHRGSFAAAAAPIVSPTYTRPSSSSAALGLVLGDSRKRAYDAASYSASAANSPSQQDGSGRPLKRQAAEAPQQQHLPYGDAMFGRGSLSPVDVINSSRTSTSHGYPQARPVLPAPHYHSTFAHALTPETLVAPLAQQHFDAAAARGAYTAQHHAAPLSYYTLAAGSARGTLGQYLPPPNPGAHQHTAPARVTRPMPSTPSPTSSFNACDSSLRPGGSRHVPAITPTPYPTPSGRSARIQAYSQAQHAQWHEDSPLLALASQQQQQQQTQAWVSPLAAMSILGVPQPQQPAPQLAAQDWRTQYRPFVADTHAWPLARTNVGSANEPFAFSHFNNNNVPHGP